MAINIWKAITNICYGLTGGILILTRRNEPILIRGWDILNGLRELSEMARQSALTNRSSLPACASSLFVNRRALGQGATRLIPNLTVHTITAM